MSIYMIEKVKRKLKHDLKTGMVKIMGRVASKLRCNGREVIVS